MNVIRRFSLALFLAFGALAIIGTIHPASAQKPIVIGVATGLSGPLSTVAPAVVQSSELAVAEINAAGGILGRPVKLVVADDGSSAVGGQRAFQDLIYRRGADVVITMETTASLLGGLPVVERGKVPLIYSSLYEGHVCSPYLYVNGTVPIQSVNPVIDYLMKEKDAKTFFLIGSDYAFGRGMLKAARAHVENQGGKVVGEEYEPMDATDWTPIITQVRRANVDAVLTATAGGAPNITLLRQYKGAGMQAPVVAFSLDQQTAQKLGKDANNVYIVASYVTTIDNKANQKFLAAMKTMFGDEARTPSELSEPQYDAVYLYKLAVEKAGTTATDAVLKALPEVSFDGPRGKVQMDVQHHATLTMRRVALHYANGSVKAEVMGTYENISPGEQCPDL